MQHFSVKMCLFLLVGLFVNSCVSSNAVSNGSHDTTDSYENNNELSENRRLYPSDLGNVTFLTDTTWIGLEANKSVWITADRGRTWSKTQTFAPVKDRRPLEFLDKNVGYFLSDYELWKTVDGGDDWIKVEGLRAAIDIERDSVDGVFFLDEQNGWVVGGSFSVNDGRKGIIFKTSDGGQNWNRQVIAEENKIAEAKGNRWDIRRINFLNEKVGWAVGYGVVLQTSNGGAEWRIIDSFEGIFEGIHFFDSSSGIIRERLPEASFFTIDAGKTWSPLQLPKGSIEGSFLINKKKEIILCNSNGQILALEAKSFSWDTGNKRFALEKTKSREEIRFEHTFIGRSFNGNIVCLMQNDKTNSITSYSSSDEGETWNQN